MNDDARRRRLGILIAALIAGGVIGWIDLSATEVQGTLLLLMVAAFLLSLLGSAAPWLVAVATAIGPTLAQTAAWLVGHNALAPDGRALIAVVPALVAAYAGRWMGKLVAAAAATVPQGSVGPDEGAAGAPSMPWYARRTGSRVLLGAVLLGAAAAGGPAVYFALATAGERNTWWVATIWQVVTLMGWMALTPVAIGVRRGSSDRVTPSELAGAVAVVAALAVLHTAALVLMTRLLFIPLGAVGALAQWGYAFAVYLPLDIVVVVLLRVLAYASDADRHAREAADAAALQSAALAAELQAARLAALRAQLQPHFLFNALNSATVLARRGDADRAARVLTDLGELLRYVLRDAGDMVRLDEELEFVERFLAIERMRFPDRLRATIDADPVVRSALVPALLLQPLVENALRHGIARRVGAGELIVRARREGGVVHVIVQDDGAGPALPDEAMPNDMVGAGRGVGLSNTRARLATLYGAAAAVTLERGAHGGAVARVTLPFRATKETEHHPAGFAAAGGGGPSAAGDGT